MDTTYQAQPQALSRDEFEHLWSGRLILITHRSVLPGMSEKFDISWFIPAIIKYKKHLTQVLVASFLIQLFALISPLFFQVMIDKVRVHQGLSTLDVLCFGLLVISLFYVLLNGLRTYVFSHTTNRVDVTLGAKLFSHLLRLPIGFFNARRVGDTVARVRELKAWFYGGATMVQAEVAKKQRKQNLATLQDNALQIAALQQELIKAAERNNQQVLTAPISGRVQQLAVHTIGGVVTPAQPLMIIVPEQSRLEVEALILNKDIGFVKEGQPAAVKIDTFNFTKYGLIDADILSISDDAIQDEKLGLVYSARLTLKQDGIQVEDKWVKLSPGMSVVSEIKTGQRRIIEFFLSPLLRYRQESLGER